MLVKTRMAHSPTGDCKVHAQPSSVASVGSPCVRVCAPSVSWSVHVCCAVCGNRARDARQHQALTTQITVGRVCADSRDACAPRPVRVPAPPAVGSHVMFMTLIHSLRTSTARSSFPSTSSQCMAPRRTGETPDRSLASLAPARSARVSHRTSADTLRGESSAAWRSALSIPHCTYTVQL